MLRTPRCGHPLRRRIAWISSPLVILLSVILAAYSITGTHSAAVTPPPAEVAHFQFEQQAQQHCPEDSVVWAIAHLGIYNSSVERWYGQTTDGAFMCLHDAENAGYRATRSAK